MDKRWGEILEKDEMVQGMAEINDPEKFQEFLKAHGYDFTIEEIRAFGEELAEQYSEEAGGELTDNDLEDVAGGASFWRPTVNMVLGCAGIISNSVLRCKTTGIKGIPKGSLKGIML